MPVMTAEHRAMKSIHRTKSEPILYSGGDTATNFSSSYELSDIAGHCWTLCNGTDKHPLCVEGENIGATSVEGCDDDESQYVALDCEFVGVGPNNSSALGTYIVVLSSNP